VKPWHWYLLALPWLGASSAQPTTSHQLWLWAWERPERFDFLADENDVGVAYLAATLRLEHDDVRFLPRRQSIQLDDATPFALVVRIETPTRAGATLSDAQRRSVVRHVQRLVRDANATRVQIDFDARMSERAFYRALLLDLRAGLPSGTELTMTALASWCFEEGWLDELASLVDGVVPMVFTMGIEGRAVHARLSRHRFPEPSCTDRVGVRLGEPFPPLIGYRQVYAFSARSWSKHTYGALRAELRRAPPR